ncbi:MAG: metal-dependent hydrolase [Pyrinomonadaceae bacterium]
MDNLTHSLVGLAASKAGLEKLSPHATLVSVLAANAPDSDLVVLMFGDRWTFLEHHRGITHSIVGTLTLGIIVPLVFSLLERLVAKLRGRRPAIKLKNLLVVSLIVGATHPLLDWTNNYGIRPLLPWSSRWFYGDFVFIIDSVFWLVLGGACFLLTAKTKLQVVIWLVVASILTALVIAVPAQRGFENQLLIRVCWLVAITTCVLLFKLRVAQRFGNKIAVAAFALVVLYCGSLATIHQFAISQARIQAQAIASQNGESVTDVAAMPTLANPLQWTCVVETEQAAYRFELLLGIRQSAVEGPVRYERADTSTSAAVKRASRDRRAQIFLGFARFPVFRTAGVDCVTGTLVQFADLRYTQPGSARGSFSLEVPLDCPVEDAK